MKSTSFSFVLLSTAVLSATVAMGASPAPSGSDSHPKLWTNPTPHVYQPGERLNPMYGPIAEIPDWKDRGLLTPAQGHRWVQYADTYLLIESDSGLIATITMASRPEGRA